MYLRSSISTASHFFEEVMNFTMCQDHEYGRIIWCICSIFSFLVGFPAYIFIFYECYKKYSSGSFLLTPNIFFMLNLSVMDTVFLAVLPFGLGNHFILHIWTMEAIWNGIYSLSVCGRPLIIACVCIDCYLAVVHPLSYRNWTTLTPRVIVAAVIWLLTLAFGLAIGINYVIYMSYVSICPYMLAVVIIIVCDSFILYTLMKTGPGGKNVHLQKQRAIQTVTNSLVASLLSYMPPVFMYIIGEHLITDANLYFCSVIMPCTIFSSMGSALMPLLFLQNLGGFDRLKLWCSKI